MISAVDSSVILDVVVRDPANVDQSEQTLRSASQQGKLVACECVFAEIRPAFASSDLFVEFATDWQLEFVPSSLESASLAGEHFAAYLQRGGRHGRVLADFLVGAHATLHADRLLARDRGYLRDYFQNLVVLDPSRTA